MPSLVSNHLKLTVKFDFRTFQTKSISIDLSPRRLLQEKNLNHHFLCFKRESKRGTHTQI